MQIYIYIYIFFFDTTFNLERSIRGGRQQYMASGQIETRAGDLSA